MNEGIEFFHVLSHDLKRERQIFLVLFHVLRQYVKNSIPSFVNVKNVFHVLSHDLHIWGGYN